MRNITQRQHSRNSHVPPLYKPPSSEPSIIRTCREKKDLPTRTWQAFFWELIGGSLLCEKAVYLNRKLEDFLHVMFNLDMASVSIVFRVKNLLTLHLPLHTDETGQFWRNLPSRILAFKRSILASGYKLSKEQVTPLDYANATRTQRIPPCLQTPPKSTDE